MMRFIFCLHQHQPEGTAPQTLDRLYRDAYLPVLRAIDAHPSVRVVLHNSGCLVENLLVKRPEYIELLQALVERRQVELLSSPIYEPILAIIPERDRVGQLRSHQELIERLFGVVPRGLWLAEGVWEPSLPKVIGQAGLEYLPLDDTPFLQTGMAEKRLYESYITEEEGLSVRVFPVPRSVRHLIPAARPEEVISQLLKRQAGGARVAVYTGDGERFVDAPSNPNAGPRWLAHFFSLLENELNRIQTCTFEECVDAVEPAGQVYLPAAAHAEIMEWSIPPEPQRRHHDLRVRLEEEGDGLERLLTMGFWRNFLVRYPEANWMHKRGLDIGRRLRRLEEQGAQPEGVEAARRHLWRAQGHAPYWHGVEGGLYEPRLRAAVHANQIRAWRILDDLEHDGAAFLSMGHRDINLDGEQEVVIENRELAVTVAPKDGGSIVAIDQKSAAVNLLDTVARREETYHRAVREHRSERAAKPPFRRGRGIVEGGGYLNYDPFPLHSLRDHFVSSATSVGALKDSRTLAASPARERFDWEREGPGTLRMWASFRLDNTPIAIERVITLDPAAARFEIASHVELPEGIPEELGTFVTEWTLGCPNPASTAVSMSINRTGRRPFAAEEDDAAVGSLLLRDGERSFEAEIRVAPDATLFRFPIETVSLAEDGPERVLQGTRIFFAWRLPPGARRFASRSVVEMRVLAPEEVERAGDGVPRDGVAQGGELARGGPEMAAQD